MDAWSANETAHFGCRPMGGYVAALTRHCRRFHSFMSWNAFVWAAEQIQRPNMLHTSPSTTNARYWVVSEMHATRRKRPGGNYSMGKEGQRDIRSNINKMYHCGGRNIGRKIGRRRAMWPESGAAPEGSIYTVFD